MTGYYPFRTGTQDGVFLHMEASGVPLDFPFLPHNLGLLGYSSHLVGKWHLGYCKRAFLPTRRGFRTFYGYYGPQQGYFNHSTDMWDRNTGRVVGGLDFFRERDGVSEPIFDALGDYSTVGVTGMSTGPKGRLQDVRNPFLHVPFSFVPGQDDMTEMSRNFREPQQPSNYVF